MSGIIEKWTLGNTFVREDIARVQMDDFEVKGKSDRIE